jgi:hypothetical protein
MARTGGTANSVILATPTLSGVGNTTLSTDATVGARTLAVTAGAGIPNGTFIQLQSNAGTSLTGYYQVIGGGTTNTLTLDRPLQEPWKNTDTVKPVSVMPRDVNVIGPGNIVGNGDNGVSFVGVRRGTVFGINVDVKDAASGAACLVGGIDLDLGCFAVIVEGCVASGFNLAANADEFTVGIGLASCESCRVVRSAGRHATIAGIFLTNSFSCVVDQCEGTDCAGTATGIAVSGTAATSAGGSTDCVVSNSYVGDSAFGLGVALATRTQVKTLVSENCTTRHVDVGTGAVAATDCVFENVTCTKGAPTTSAFNVTSSVVRPKFRNLLFDAIAGAVDLFTIACDFDVDGCTMLGTNLATGNWFDITAGPTAQSFVANLRLIGKTTLGSTNLVGIQSAAGKVFFKSCSVAVGVAADIAFRQSSNAIVTLEDVEVTNPGAVGATLGYDATGASSVLRRKGRVDMSATATPYTVVQSDQGTLTANGAAGIAVTFKDIQTTANVMVSEKTAGGTAAGGAITIAANTSFTRTGTAGDTSVYYYKVMD